MVKLVRTWGAGVIALLVLSLSAIEMPHMDGAHHDPDCDIIIVAHDASAHHVNRGRPVQHERSEHCLACHWGRSFKPGVESGALKAPIVETIVASVPDQPFVPSRAPVAQPSLRAPPA